MQLKYSIAVFLAAAFWGLYWWPLRAIESNGVTAQWSVVAIYVVPLLALLPYTFVKRKVFAEHWRTLLFIGAAAGAGLSCYATAFLYTSVVRTVLLFYMMPVWATLMAIVFLNESNSPRRWMAMLTGFVGLSLMLFTGSDSQAGIPFSIGDFIALLSGIFWGMGTVLIRRSPNIEPMTIVPAQYLFALVISVFFLFTLSPAAPLPPATAWISAMPYLIGFYVLIVLPTLYICAVGSQVLSPGRIGILMMSEVLVAGLSAPLLAGESLSLREIIAALLIIMAGVIEVFSPTDTNNNPLTSTE
jgi:drug/metabolite transporter (DMT)-like permease